MTLAVFGLMLSCSALAAAEVLIVADEIPAMEVLAGKLKAAGVQSTIVQQTAMPAELSKYSALVVYIHRTIGEPAEKAFVNYAESGGRLVLLHHSISSGKRANKYWFPFLKISLPAGSLEQGGYKYLDPVVMEVVNLAPREFITTHNVAYDRKVRYRDQGELPGFRLENTEVYLNHVLTAPRTVLLGLKFTDPKSGQTYMQDSAGWYMKAGQGWVMYFMAGHSARDFENPAYAQILVNALVFQPKK